MANTIKGPIPWLHRPWFYRPKQDEIASADNIRKQYQEKTPAFITRTTPAMGISLLIAITSGSIWQAGKNKLGTIGKWISLSTTFGGIFSLFLSKWMRVKLKSSSDILGNTKFKLAAPMLYANNDQTKKEFELLKKTLKAHLKTVSKDSELSFKPGSTIYIPDTHGDFVHLIQTLHQHDVLDENLNLKHEYSYVFLGDFYDRGEDSDVVDYWLNFQIQNNAIIYRLIGNHELMFLIRNKEGHSPFDPSNDVEKDIKNNFQVTEELLKNIAEGNILAAYVEPHSSQNGFQAIYTHSFIKNNDLKLSKLSNNCNIEEFATMLNKRFMECGKTSYSIFLEAKKVGHFNWKQIISPFKSDPLFSHRGNRKTFFWRRPPVSLNDKDKYLPAIKDIPDNVLQIVGHTPVFYFDHPNLDELSPLLIQSSNSTGQVLFSDVGISYYYNKSDLARPDVIINKQFAQTLNT